MKTEAVLTQGRGLPAMWLREHQEIVRASDLTLRDSMWSDSRGRLVLAFPGDYLINKYERGSEVYCLGKYSPETLALKAPDRWVQETTIISDGSITIEQYILVNKGGVESKDKALAFELGLLLEELDSHAVKERLWVSGDKSEAEHWFLII